jgi:hypothetical protein
MPAILIPTEVSVAKTIQHVIPQKWWHTVHLPVGIGFTELLETGSYVYLQFSLISNGAGEHRGHWQPFTSAQVCEQQHKYKGVAPLANYPSSSLLLCC